MNIGDLYLQDVNLETQVQFEPYHSIIIDD